MSGVKTFRPPRVIVPEWGTYIEGRSPAFKIHKTLGQAKQALAYTISNPLPRGGIIYRWDAGRDEWEEWFSYEQPRVCDRCGGREGEEVSPHRRHTDYHPERRGMKINSFQKPMICDSCYWLCFSHRSKLTREEQDREWLWVYAGERWRERVTALEFPGVGK